MEALRAIGQLSAKLTMSPSHGSSSGHRHCALSNGVSLVLAFLMDSFLYEVNRCPNITEPCVFFKKHEDFVNWLENIVRSNSDIREKFCLRVAFRYYILESLTRFPTIRKVCGWESENPVQKIWKAYLEVRIGVAQMLEKLLSSIRIPWNSANPDSSPNKPSNIDMEIGSSSKSNLDHTPSSSDFSDLSNNAGAAFINKSDDFRSFKFSLFFDKLRSQSGCASMWKRIADAPLTLSEESEDLPQTVTQENFMRLLRSKFDRWRGSGCYVSINHSHQKREVSELINHLCQLTPWKLGKQGTLSCGSSLVLAFLMDPLFYEGSNNDPETKRFSTFKNAIFKDRHFIKSLDDIVGSELKIKHVFCLRVAYRYYILESLRRSSELLSKIRKIYKWESDNPMKEMWKAYLEKYVPWGLSQTHWNFLGVLMTQVFLNGVTTQGTLHDRETLEKIWRKILLLGPMPLDTGASEVSVNELKTLWQHFCGYLGIFHYCSSDTFSNKHSQSDTHNQSDTYMEQQETRFPYPVSDVSWASQGSNVYKRLLHSALAMLAEARGRWDSMEWLLILSVFSIYYENEDEVWQSLKALESEILVRNTICERVIFRYFLMAYGRSNGISTGTWVDILRSELGGLFGSEVKWKV
eukprot:Gregarina_sp_Poly_1__2053@NODE_153_length_12491_cov_49_511993_g135_i0_p2_GENE_NODE_153_length_12491_cov_49_511993_g135_i0NODE_153_length_12491_cov_49_511993_g135_i0_p2_ORF_typecomplete_len636_score67_72_NODE_153_length_12491_cov_49_511993_g135_i0994311850